MKKLLFSVTKKDLEVQTFRSGGKGGQHQNKRDTGVRIIHKPSGARGEARDTKSQDTNRKHAFSRLTQSKKFKSWHKLEVAKKLGRLVDIDKLVENDMQEKNLKVEYFDPSKRKHSRAGLKRID